MWRGIVNKAFTADNVGDYLQTLRPPSFVQFIVVHNTGAPSLKTYRGYANRANPITDTQWLRNLEKYYRDQQGWSAGPHWFVTPNEQGLLAFTPSTVQGTHTPSWNSKSLGIETVGDFQVEPFNADTRRNLVALLAALHSWLGLDPETMRFHKEDARTTHKDCPGKNIVKSDLIAAVRAKMDESGGSPQAFLGDVPRCKDGHSAEGEQSYVETDSDGYQPPSRDDTSSSPISNTLTMSAKSMLRSKIGWAQTILAFFGIGTVGSQVDASAFDKFKAFVFSPGFMLLVMAVCIGLTIYWRWSDHGRGSER